MPDLAIPSLRPDWTHIGYIGQNYSSYENFYVWSDEELPPDQLDNRQLLGWYQQGDSLYSFHTTTLGGITLLAEQNPADTDYGANIYCRYIPNLIDYNQHIEDITGIGYPALSKLLLTAATQHIPVHKTRPNWAALFTRRQPSQ